jgi:hypothetical protein
MKELVFAGFDQNARRVFVTEIERFEDIGRITPPAPGPFAFFIGGDASATSDITLRPAAEAVLAKGAVYILVWGTDCQRVEAMFDRLIASATSEESEATIMTTCYPEESLEVALTFAANFAIPEEGYEADMLIIAIVSSAGLLERARNCLGHLLGSEPPVAKG